MVPHESLRDRSFGTRTRLHLVGFLSSSVHSFGQSPRRRSCSATATRRLWNVFLRRLQHQRSIILRPAWRLPFETPQQTAACCCCCAAVAACQRGESPSRRLPDWHCSRLPWPKLLPGCCISLENRAPFPPVSCLPASVFACLPPACLTCTGSHLRALPGLPAWLVISHSVISRTWRKKVERLLVGAHVWIWAPGLGLPRLFLCSQRRAKKRKRDQPRRLGRRADVPQKNWRSPGASGGPAPIGAFRPPCSLQPPARSDLEAPIRLAGQEGAVPIASAVAIAKIRSS